MSQAETEAGAEIPGTASSGGGSSTSKRPQCEHGLAAIPASATSRRPHVQRCCRRGGAGPSPPPAADALPRVRSARGSADITAACAASLAALTSPPRLRGHARRSAHWAEPPTPYPGLRENAEFGMKRKAYVEEKRDARHRGMGDTPEPGAVVCDERQLRRPPNPRGCMNPSLLQDPGSR